jgi:hypothetical protein
MGITLKDIIKLAKELPEECFEETYETLRELKDKAAAEQITKARELSETRPERHGARREA